MIHIEQILRGGLAALLGATLAGCVSAPRATLELSDVVAEQTASLQSSHRQLVEAYFAELERRIDDFVDYQWTPDFLARAVASEQVQQATDEIRAGMDIDADRLRRTVTESRAFTAAETEIVMSALESAQLGYRAQLGQVMIDFSSSALLEINNRRRSLKAPLEENRRKLLASLDESYSNLQAGQAALRAHLASVVQLVEEQDQILAKLNLLKQRDAAMDAAIEAGDGAAKAAEKLIDAERRVDTLRNKRRTSIPTE